MQLQPSDRKQAVDTGLVPLTGQTTQVGECRSHGEFRGSHGLQALAAVPLAHLLRVHVLSTFREQGLLGIETWTVETMMPAALNLVECRAETAPRSPGLM